MFADMCMCVCKIGTAKQTASLLNVDYAMVKIQWTTWGVRPVVLSGKV